MIKLKDLLKEELIGKYKDTYEVFKNPKSIKRMESYLRGVSIPTGDFFVVDSSVVIHISFHRWLRTEGIKLPTMVSSEETANAINRGYINWHRKGSTDVFYSSESTGDIDQNILVNLHKYIKKINQKNPKYKFMEEPIWGHR